MSCAASDRVTLLPTVADLGLPQRPVELADSVGAAAHSRARIDDQVREMLAHHVGVMAGGDPEDLHQFRVAVRRLRSLLGAQRLFGARGKNLRRRLRVLADVTGPVRDLDVLMLRVRDHIADFDQADRTAAGALISALAAEREQRHARLVAELTSTNYRDLLTSIAVLATSADQVDATQDKAALLAAVRSQFRTVSRAAGSIGPESPDADVHALRIKAKHLRYAAETALPALGRADTATIDVVIKRCRALQDVLGEHQDAVVAAERVRALVNADTPPAAALVAGRIIERERQRRAAARAEWPARWRRVVNAATPLL